MFDEKVASSACGTADPKPTPACGTKDPEPAPACGAKDVLYQLSQQTTLPFVVPTTPDWLCGRVCNKIMKLCSNR